MGNICSISQSLRVKTIQVKMIVLEELQTLRLEGLLIDSIDRISGLVNLSKDWEDDYKEWEVFARMDDPFRRYVGGGDFCEAFWRTLIMDSVIGPETHDDGHVGAPETDRQVFLVYTGRNVVPIRITQDILSRDRSIRRCLIRL